MNVTKQQIILLAAGVLVGYMASQKLDDWPIFEDLPKLR